MLGTMSAVKELAADFAAVTDGFAFSLRADRHPKYRAFEAVEDHAAAVRQRGAFLPTAQVTEMLAGKMDRPIGPHEDRIIAEARLARPLRPCSQTVRHLFPADDGA